MTRWRRLVRDYEKRIEDGLLQRNRILQYPAIRRRAPSRSARRIGVIAWTVRFNAASDWARQRRSSAIKAAISCIRAIAAHGSGGYVL
jgi:hypothetical protein